MFLLLSAIIVIQTVLGNPVEKNLSLTVNRLGVIGGDNGDISDHPWQVSFQYRNQHFCGGFLISNRWVVTAAHCLTEGYTKKISIRAGSSLTNTGGQTSDISRYIIHSDYIDNGSYNNDIALLYLSTAITTGSAMAATIPDQGENIADDVNVTLSGWGITSETGSTSSTQLLQVQVPTISREKCKAAYSAINDVTENMFCAGLLETGGKDACTGDSGGPVELDGIIVGIVSWGTGCGRKEYPGVYTKVSNYRNWIRDNTGV